MNPTAWINSHKAQAGVGAAALVGGLALYQRHKAASTSSAAPASTTTSAVAPTSSYDSSGIDEYGQLSNAISNANDQISTLGSQVASLAAGSVPSASTSTVSPCNEYPVGTVVNGRGSTIVQAVPADGGFVSVSSTGGLYTTGIAGGVSGSAASPLIPPAGFQYSAQVNGNEVYEYTPTGVQQYALGPQPTAPQFSQKAWAKKS